MSPNKDYNRHVAFKIWVLAIGVTGFFMVARAADAITHQLAAIENDLQTIVHSCKKP